MFILGEIGKRIPYPYKRRIGVNGGGKTGQDGGVKPGQLGVTPRPACLVSTPERTCISEPE
jgi:hypothetical protein